MSKEYIISVMSRDKVGIVAEVTTIISELGGNLEDLSQTVMRGYFSMILLAAMPDGITEEQMRKALKASAVLADAEIGVCGYTGSKVVERIDENANLYVLTSAGPDKPGQVAAVSRYLRERGINIVDLATRLNHGEYTMVLLVDIPKDTDIAKLRNSLQLSVDSLGLKVELRHRDLFRKTNEI